MRKPTVVAVLMIAAACTDHAPFLPNEYRLSASISDAAHGGGAAGFYFLPPLVMAPATSGAFDASLLPFTMVEVCRLSPVDCAPVAQFTAQSGTACVPKGFTAPPATLLHIVLEDELYVTNWQTHDCDLDPSSTYRIRVVVAGTELGHADIDVVQNGAGLKNVDTEQYVGLVDGRTLPIKFRIEEGAVFVVGAAGGTIVAAAGQVILRIPEDALASAIAITVKPGPSASPEEGTIPGTVWEFGPEGIDFRMPAELTIRYDPAALPQDLIDPAASLTVVTEEEGEWSEIPAAIDDETHVVRAMVFGFSIKALAEKTLAMDVEPWSVTLAPAATLVLKATAHGSRGTTLRKRAINKVTLDARVATVDETGVVRAVAPGVTAVRLTARLPRRFPPGFCPPWAGCLWPGRDIPVVVPRPVASVTVSPASASVVVGGTVQLIAELRDAEGSVLTDREVTWASTAEEVASVDASGRVTGRAPGGADIRVASEGITASAQVHVVPGGRRAYSWTPMSSGSSRSLRAIWGTSASQVFAAADLFELLRFDGTIWFHVVGPTLDSLAFGRLSGRAANDAYAVGSRRMDAPPPCGNVVTGRTNRAFVLRFDGTSWSDAGFPFYCNSAHRGLWVGSQTVVAVGNSPFDPTVDVSKQLGRVWRLQNGAWRLEFSLSHELSAFLDAWGSGEQDIYAVGGRNLFESSQTRLGVITHYDGVSWTVIADEIDHPLNAVWGTSSTDVFAVGQDGIILHFDGATWTRQESGVTVNLNGVWGSGSDNVLAVGAAGTILQYDGRTWTRLESGTTTGLASIWMTTSGDKAFVVGQGGLIRLGMAQP